MGFKLINFKALIFFLIPIFFVSEFSHAKIGTRMRKANRAVAVGGSVNLTLVEETLPPFTTYAYIFTLTNSGTGVSGTITYSIPVHIGKAPIGSILGYYVSATDCTTLNSGQSCTISIDYDDGGVQTGACVISHTPFIAYSNLIQSNTADLVGSYGWCGGGPAEDM